MVDTSIWIDYFNQRPSPQVGMLNALLTETNTVLLGDLVLTEVLQGLKFKGEIEQIETQFLYLPVHLMVGEPIARRSAELYRQLRSQGITVRNTVDCLIATWCIENNAPLLHNDRDFKHFAPFGLVEAIPE